METRILSTLFHCLGLIALIIGCVQYFPIEQHEFSDLFHFMPTTIAFGLGIIIGLFDSKPLRWTSNFNPITNVIIVVVIFLVFAALIFRLINDDESASATFGWAFNFFTFGVGLEAGRTLESRARREKTTQK